MYIAEVGEREQRRASCEVFRGEGEWVYVKKKKEARLSLIHRACDSTYETRPRQWTSVPS